MEKDDLIKAALEIFPKVYYFIPHLKWQTVKADRKENVKKYVLIEENRAAILWLLEQLADEGEGVTSQRDLRIVVGKWSGILDHPARFSKELQGLYEIGLIRFYRKSEDRRMNYLSLTPKGKRVLKAIKAQMEEYLRAMFQEVPPEAMQTLIKVFEKIAQRTWEKAKSVN